ncbi:hypothetical protein RRG08_065615 [Elysia crispata]|uniref:Uncharacterized protein n=1 Tax=Elysia crispata TaxID=231223 RepID=A0AAE0YMT3_9GAST|nr:hypothetical protein RRG08_065615 [Elysia crispata]
MDEEVVVVCLARQCSIPSSSSSSNGTCCGDRIRVSAINHGITSSGESHARWDTEPETNINAVTRQRASVPRQPYLSSKVLFISVRESVGLKSFYHGESQSSTNLRPLYGSQGFLGFHSADKSQNSAAGAVFSGFWVREKQTLN